MIETKIKPIIVYYSIVDCGDGSAYPRWFLTEEAANNDQDEMDPGWGECCTGMVETYEGSNVHKEALKNSVEDD